MISREEILKGQELPPELEDNLRDLLTKLNRFREVYGKPMIVTSGYRSKEHNLQIGGRGQSAHLIAKAVDFLDTDRSLMEFCLDNLPLLESLGLWMEDPIYTSDWIHLQTRPASQTVFIP